jgi:hypothetical protein
MFSQGQAKPAALEWCLPIVHDCLGEFYAQHFPSQSSALKALTQAQFALWTALVRGDGAAARVNVALLDRKAAALGLNGEVCGAADRYVAAELLALSLRRFRRMHEEARTTNQALLTLLMQLNRRATAPAPARRRAA